MSKIRKYLSEDSAKTLTHAFVTSRLDNMNSLLYDLPKVQIDRLQNIQDHSVRIIKQKRKFDHITSDKIELHWLPVEFRIKFKILLLVYKCLHGKGPAYLASMLEEHCPPRVLRSATQLRLRAPPVPQKRYGDRAFSVAGPVLWNKLPMFLKKSPSVDSFKRNLKTYLFKRAHNL